MIACPCGTRRLVDRGWGRHADFCRLFLAAAHGKRKHRHQKYGVPRGEMRSGTVTPSEVSGTLTPSEVSGTLTPSEVSRIVTPSEVEGQCLCSCFGFCLNHQP